jgi:hypothetical protein
MKLQVVALYPGRIAELMAQSGVKERKRKGGSWTQVPCELVTDDRASLAKPIHRAPEGASRPVFKVQLELSRAEDEGRVVALVLSSDETKTSDPEQQVLAPMYNNGRRVLFEFQRAEILIVNINGDVELRIVAVHPMTGIVGTKTKYVFHARFAKLVARCQSYLAGSIDLFPPQDHAASRLKDFHVPSGPADLDVRRQTGLPLLKSHTGASRRP